jgi:hypothetical protein
MDSWEGLALAGIGFVLIYLFGILKSRGKALTPPSPPARKTSPPAPPSQAAPQPIPEKSKLIASGDPTYLPRRNHPAAALLKKAKSQKQLFILSEIFRRPYP